MKKYLLVVLSCLFGSYVSAQILCVQCYDQNAPISFPINNLILNGGFENGCITGSFCPPSIYYLCNVPDWTCIGGGTDTYASIIDSTGDIFNTFISEIVEGNQAAYFGNGFNRTCSSNNNDTSCLVNTGCITTGIPALYPSHIINYGGSLGLSLIQNVNGLVVGNAYALELWAGGEYDFLSPGNGLFAVDVGFGNIFLRNKSTNIGAVGKRYIIQFIADSSSHPIKFTNWGHCCNHCNELVLDDVRLYTIAELSTSIPNCTVGLNELNENFSTRVYPNPSNGILTLSYHSSSPKGILHLMDLTGKIVFTQTLSNAQSTQQINARGLSDGFYLYEIVNEDKALSKGKLVIVK